MTLLKRPTAPMTQRERSQPERDAADRYIHLGVKDAARKGAPRETDYFVVHSRLHSRLGSEPRSLNITLTSNYFADFFTVKYVAFGANGRQKCFSYDGCTAEERGQDGVPRLITCPQQYHNLATGGYDVPSGVQPCQNLRDCKSRLRFKFLIPEIDSLNCFVLSSGSWHSRENLLDDLTHVARLRNPIYEGDTIVGGDLAGVGFVLYREEIKTPQKGSDKMASHWTLRLRLNDEWTAAYNRGLIAAQQAHLGRLMQSVDATQQAMVIDTQPVAGLIESSGDIEQEDVPNEEPVQAVEAVPMPSTAKEARRLITSTLVESAERLGVSKADALAALCLWLTERFDHHVESLSGATISTLPESVAMEAGKLLACGDTSWEGFLP